MRRDFLRENRKCWFLLPILTDEGVIFLKSWEMHIHSRILGMSSYPLISNLWFRKFPWKDKKNQCNGNLWLRRGRFEYASENFALFWRGLNADSILCLEGGHQVTKRGFAKDRSYKDSLLATLLSPPYRLWDLEKFRAVALALELEEIPISPPLDRLWNLEKFRASS